MSETPQNGPDRLDSWKAIAAYLRRDETTVRRWERQFGLPIRRTPGGRGHSVYAFQPEIDAWLKTSPFETAPRGGEPAAVPSLRLRRAWLAPAAAVVVVAVSVGLVVATRAARPAAELRVEAADGGVAAFDAGGAPRWQYQFPPAYVTELVPDMGHPIRVLQGRNPAVYVAEAIRTRRSDGLQESGVLTELTLDGRRTASFSLSDRVTFHGTTFGEPWAMTSFAVDDTGPRQIAVAAHHAVWGASIVAVLDGQLHRRGTFVHSGWIEMTQWISPRRLLIGGFSNAHDGGMVALVDPAALDGQGPEQAGSPHYCETCGAGRPVKMIVFPRSELNRVTGSPFNRARVFAGPGGIVARTIEAPSPGQHAEAIYELTPELELVRASFSDRYWDMHQELEREGKLHHTREQRPDKDGPREILVWEPETGWKTQRIR